MKKIKIKQFHLKMITKITKANQKIINKKMKAQNNKKRTLK